MHLSANTFYKYNVYCKDLKYLNASVAKKESWAP